MPHLGQKVNFSVCTVHNRENCHKAYCQCDLSWDTVKPIFSDFHLGHATQFYLSIEGGL